MIEIIRQQYAELIQILIGLLAYQYICILILKCSPCFNIAILTKSSMFPRNCSVQDILVYNFEIPGFSQKMTN